MKAKVYINYKEGILDPQGATVKKALKTMGFEGIKEIRIGKLIEINYDSISKEKAIELTNTACIKLLSNPNTESYTFEIED